jgi:hypothetical protein
MFFAILWRNMKKIDERSLFGKNKALQVGRRRNGKTKKDCISHFFF